MADSSTTSRASSHGVDLESRLKARIEQALNDIGEGYNDIEEQLHSFSKANLIERLEKLEEQAKADSESDSQRKTTSPSTPRNRASSRNDEGSPEHPTSLQAISRTVKSLEFDVNAIMTSKATEFSSRLDKQQQRLSKLEKQSRKTYAVLHNQGELGQTLENLLLRLQMIESRTQPSNDVNSIATLSAMELAEALMDRLDKGQVVGEAISARLHAVTANRNGNRPAARNLHTTPTDLESSNSPATKGSEQQPHKEPTPRKRASHQPQPSRHSTVPTEQQTEQESETTSPQVPQPEPQPQRASRKRPAPDPEPDEEAGTATKPTTEDQRPTKHPRGRPSNPGTKRTPPRRRAKAVQAEPQAEVGAQEGEDEDENEQSDDGTPQDPRRTSRAPKPTSKKEDFMSWIEVKAERKKDRETRDQRRQSRKHQKLGGRKRAST